MQKRIQCMRRYVEIFTATYRDDILVDETNLLARRTYFSIIIKKYLKTGRNWSFQGLKFYDRVESSLYLLHTEQINEQYVCNICPQGQFFSLLIRIVRGVYERAKDTGTANPGVSSRGSCLFRDSRDDFDFASVCHINSASLLQPK